MDVWIGVTPANAAALVNVLRKFGFAATSLSADLFLRRDRVIRMGLPPLRIDLLTSLSGVDFAPCFAERTAELIDGVEVNLISLEHLKANKRAIGRPRDLDDLEKLP